MQVKDAYRVTVYRTNAAQRKELGAMAFQGTFRNSSIQEAKDYMRQLAENDRLGEYRIEVETL